MFLISPANFGTSGNVKLIDVLTSLGLLTNLKLCLDAGDSASYSGSGQVWADLSGGGFDFNRGATSSPSTDDPTFNGVAGNQSSSEYWSGDGGDYLTLGQANPTWVNDIPKNNAKYGVGAWIYYPNSASIQGVIGTFTLTATSAFNLGVNANRTFGLNVESVATNNVLTIVSTATVPINAWTFLGLSVDEGAATGFLQINGTQEAKVTTYTSPDTSNSDHILKVMDDGSGATRAANGARMANMAVWGGTSPTQTQMTNLFDATRGKFGL